MTQRAHQAYNNNQLETGVASARPVELVVMVYERIFQHPGTALQFSFIGIDAAHDDTVVQRAEMHSVPPGYRFLYSLLF